MFRGIKQSFMGESEDNPLTIIGLDAEKQKITLQPKNRGSSCGFVKSVNGILIEIIDEGQKKVKLTGKDGKVSVNKVGDKFPFPLM
jgi:hypothetical protein